LNAGFPFEYRAVEQRPGAFARDLFAGTCLADQGLQGHGVLVGHTTGLSARARPLNTNKFVACWRPPPSTMAPVPIAEMEKDPLEAFKTLVCSAGSKPKPYLKSKFVKKMEEIPSLELDPEDPCKLALLLAENALIGKFTGLWPSPKIVEAWMEDHWMMLIQGNVTLYAVGRGFFAFSFMRKADRDLVFRSGPYFMGSKGLFLAPWTLDFNPEAEITAAPVWVRLPHLPLHLWGISSLEDIGTNTSGFQGSGFREYKSQTSTYHIS